MKTCKIILYDEPTVPEIQLERLEKFLTETFLVEIELRKNFFQYSNDSLFEKIASTRIFNLKKQFKKHNPSAEDIVVEKENKDMSPSSPPEFADRREDSRPRRETIASRC